jgi:Leucine-rich repeat (LRR) protein
MKYFPINLFKFLHEVTEIFVDDVNTRMDAPKSGHFLLAKRVERIYMRNQRFKALGPRIFEGAPKLVTLKLDNNEISSLDEDIFFALENLKTLTLSSNELKTIPENLLATLNSLEFIDLSSNILFTLPKSLFESNRMLHRIKFDHNRFLMISPFFISERTQFNFLDGFCINQTFDKTSKLNEFLRTDCQIKTELSEIVASYKEQKDIDEICQSKHALQDVKKEFADLQEEFKQLEDEVEELELDIVKLQIYKNAKC